MNELDALRASALRLRTIVDEFDYQLLLPYEVCAETLNVIGRKLGRATAVAVGRELLAMHGEGGIVLVASSPHVVKRAVALQETGVGGPSFTDCLVMATADDHGTPYIFGFDATFKKNGYSLPSAGDAKMRVA